MTEWQPAQSNALAALSGAHHRRGGQRAEHVRR
jgi:hypothetical protein